MHKSDKAIKDLIAGDGGLGAFAMVLEFFSYFALAVYVFLQLGRDRTAKDMMLDLSSLKIFE